MKIWSLFIFCLFVTGHVFGQAYKMNGQELVLDQPIIFKTGTSQLSDESKKSLVTIKDFLAEKSYVSILRIEGHCAMGGQEQQNLSEQRAKSVVKYLVSIGVDCKKLIAVGFGNSKPIADRSENARNNRINFFVAAIKNRLIGGMPADGRGNIVQDVCQ